MPTAVVKYDKLTVECRKCRRLIHNGGSCGGRDGILNICLVYDPIETVNQDEKTKLKKAFALACRCLADNLDCPAIDGDADFPECNGKMDNCGDGEIWECWQRYLIKKVEDESVCRVCGCTWNNACDGGCYWVESDLCSQCVGK